MNDIKRWCVPGTYLRESLGIFVERDPTQEALRIAPTAIRIQYAKRRIPGSMYVPGTPQHVIRRYWWICWYVGGIRRPVWYTRTKPGRLPLSQHQYVHDTRTWKCGIFLPIRRRIEKETKNGQQFNTTQNATIKYRLSYCCASHTAYQTQRRTIERFWFDRHESRKVKVSIKLLQVYFHDIDINSNIRGIVAVG